MADFKTYRDEALDLDFAIGTDEDPVMINREQAQAFPIDAVHTVAAAGTSFAYREHGEGEPVVFVHGSASDLRTWEQQLRAFGTQFRAISYSRRYARPNPDIQPGADDPMPVHVDDLVAFLDVTHAAPATLVGHSWGGFICLLAAIQHPRLVRRMVLMDPPVLSLFASTPPRPMELLGLFLRRPRTALAILKFGGSTVGPARKAYLRGNDEAALEIFGRGVLGDQGFERLSPARMQQVRENARAQRAQLLGVPFPPLADADVRRVGCPTLLMVGGQSPSFFHRLTDRLLELMPHAERVEIPGASHLMHEQKPEEVNQVLLEFLARHP